MDHFFTNIGENDCLLYNQRNSFVKSVDLCAQSSSLDILAVFIKKKMIQIGFFHAINCKCHSHVDIKRQKVKEICGLDFFSITHFKDNSILLIIFFVSMCVCACYFEYLS